MKRGYQRKCFRINVLKAVPGRREVMVRSAAVVTQWSQGGDRGEKERQL